MSSSKDQDAKASNEEPRRRPYEAPAVVESAVFETLALACGKTSVEAVCDFLGQSAS